MTPPPDLGPLGLSNLHLDLPIQVDGVCGESAERQVVG